MFSQRMRPLALDAERLLGLRLSLNTPLVATPELPTGPARAAIVCHLESGFRRLTVAVRSLRNGASVLYELEGENLEHSMDFSVALDAALSFAETMGFLFDDDELEKPGEDKAEGALQRWREVVGSTSPGLSPPPAQRGEPELPTGRGGDLVEGPIPHASGAAPAAGGPASAAEATQEELLLEEIADEAPLAAPGPAAPSDDPTHAARAAAEPPCSPPDASATGATLTKFRAAPPPRAADGRQPRVATPPSAPVGRVRLVRRAYAEKPADPLLRLLACF